MADSGHEFILDLVDLLLVGDIVDLRDKDISPFVFVEGPGDVEQPPPLAAVLVQDRMFAAVNLVRPAFGELGHDITHQLHIFLGDDLRKVEPVGHHLLRISRQFAHRVVHAGELSVAVQGRHANGGRVQHSAESLLARLKRVAGVTQRGNVALRPNHPYRRPVVGAIHDHGIRPHPAPAFAELHPVFGARPFCLAGDTILIRLDQTGQIVGVDTAQELFLRILDFRTDIHDLAPRRRDHRCARHQVDLEHANL